MSSVCMQVFRLMSWQVDAKLIWGCCTPDNREGLYVYETGSIIRLISRDYTSSEN